MPRKFGQSFRNFVPYSTQGQLTGMGAAERSWAHVRNIWDDAKANMTAEKAEKEVKIWEGIRREVLAIQNDLNPIDVPLYRQWTDDQVNFDLGLDKRGVAIDTTAVNERRFLNYMEGWEGQCTKKKLTLNEFKLLEKYG